MIYTEFILQEQKSSKIIKILEWCANNPKTKTAKMFENDLKKQFSLYKIINQNFVWHYFATMEEQIMKKPNIFLDNFVHPEDHIQIIKLIM